MVGEPQAPFPVVVGVRLDRSSNYVSEGKESVTQLNSRGVKLSEHKFDRVFKAGSSLDTIYTQLVSPVVCGAARLGLNGSALCYGYDSSVATRLISMCARELLSIWGHHDRCTVSYYAVQDDEVVDLLSAGCLRLMPDDDIRGATEERVESVEDIESIVATGVSQRKRGAHTFFRLKTGPCCATLVDTRSTETAKNPLEPVVEAALQRRRLKTTPLHRLLYSLFADNVRSCLLVTRLDPTTLRTASRARGVVTMARASRQHMPVALGTTPEAEETDSCKVDFDQALQLNALAGVEEQESAVGAGQETDQEDSARFIANETRSVRQDAAMNNAEVEGACVSDVEAVARLITKMAPESHCDLLAGSIRRLYTLREPNLAGACAAASAARDLNTASDNASKPDKQRLRFAVDAAEATLGGMQVNSLRNAAMAAARQVLGDATLRSSRNILCEVEPAERQFRMAESRQFKRQAQDSLGSMTAAHNGDWISSLGVEEANWIQVTESNRADHMAAMSSSALAEQELANAMTERRRREADHDRWAAGAAACCALASHVNRVAEAAQRALHNRDDLAAVQNVIEHVARSCNRLSLQEPEEKASGCNEDAAEAAQAAASAIEVLAKELRTRVEAQIVVLGRARDEAARAAQQRSAAERDVENAVAEEAAAARAKCRAEVDRDRAVAAHERRLAASRSHEVERDLDALSDAVVVARAELARRHAARDDARGDAAALLSRLCTRSGAAFCDELAEEEAHTTELEAEIELLSAEAKSKRPLSLEVTLVSAHLETSNRRVVELEGEVDAAEALAAACGAAAEDAKQCAEAAASAAQLASENLVVETKRAETTAAKRERVELTSRHQDRAALLAVEDATRAVQEVATIYPSADVYTMPPTSEPHETEQVVRQATRAVLLEARDMINRGRAIKPHVSQDARSRLEDTERALRDEMASRESRLRIAREKLASLDNDIGDAQSRLGQPQSPCALPPHLDDSPTRRRTDSLLCGLRELAHEAHEARFDRRDLNRRYDEARMELHRNLEERARLEADIEVAKAQLGRLNEQLALFDRPVDKDSTLKLYDDPEATYKSAKRIGGSALTEIELTHKGASSVDDETDFDEPRLWSSRRSPPKTGFTSPLSKASRARLSDDAW